MQFETLCSNQSRILREMKTEIKNVMDDFGNQLQNCQRMISNLVDQNKLLLDHLTGSGKTTASTSGKVLLNHPKKRQKPAVPEARKKTIQLLPPFLDTEGIKCTTVATAFYNCFFYLDMRLSDLKCLFKKKFDFKLGEKQKGILKQYTKNVNATIHLVDELIKHCVKNGDDDARDEQVELYWDVKSLFKVNSDVEISPSGATAKAIELRSKLIDSLLQCSFKWFSASTGKQKVKDKSFSTIYKYVHDVLAWMKADDDDQSKVKFVEEFLVILKK